MQAREDAAPLLHALARGIELDTVVASLVEAGSAVEPALLELLESAPAAVGEAIVSVLTQALGQGGTSFSDYRTTWGRLGGYQNELSVFRKAGSPCPVCGTPIERAVVAGRGTYYCPGCQTSG